ncbi:MAG: hypothetical protein ACOCZ3_00950 [Bacillota bacterium]
MADYYYDKYNARTEWRTDKPGSVDSLELTGGWNELEELPFENPYGGFYGFHGDGYWAGFEKVFEEIHGFKDYSFSLTDKNEFPLDHYRQRIYKKLPVSGDILEGYVTWMDPNYNKIYWHAEKRYSLPERYNIYKHWRKLDLVESDLIRDNTFPQDGPKDGYWWVRKSLYTIPAPIPVEPADGFVVDISAAQDIPPVVFKLRERQSNDPYKYHVRLRLGRRTDFIDPPVIYDSRQDNAGWEYYDQGEGLWKDFPTVGVRAKTRVRICLEISELDFGFLHWDCTAYNANWGYGVPASHRTMVVVTESDNIYYLMVGGRRYYATKLKVKESSHGEISQINFELLNNNF